VKLILIASEVENCPVYKPGDKMVIDIPEVLIKETYKICTHALAGFLPILTSLAHGATFEEFGIGEGNKGTLRCIESNGGVLFEIEKREY
jgi:uncharacterized repeat protein (TIGR04076 family)